MKKNSFCSVCASKGDTELHHIVPLSLGGPDTLSNLVELCLSCHSKAHNHRDAWREKARQGIEKAKQEGRYTGRKATIDADKVHEMHSSGMGATAIAKELGIGRASVYRILSKEER